MASSLKGSGANHIIAHGVVMIYATAAFQPRVVEDLPGITNVAADALSRPHEPGANYKIPDELQHLSPLPLPVRDERYYSTLSTSSVGWS